MPSSRHQALVGLFRQSPRLATLFLQVLNVQVPEGGTSSLPSRAPIAQTGSGQSRLAGTPDSSHFFVDLVFYNRLLRCYVLIDLKIGQVTHQDLGQMQMYVNYFDRHKTLEISFPRSLTEQARIVTKLDSLTEDTQRLASVYQNKLVALETLKKSLLHQAFADQL